MNIDKLDPDTVGVEKLVDKINELVDRLNQFEGHFHESLDTHYYTTLPRFSNEDEEVEVEPE